MLGLDLAQAGSARDGSESGACSWGRSRKPSKTVNVPPHPCSTETAEPSFGNGDFLFDAGNFTDRSEPLAVQICSFGTVRSFFGFALPVRRDAS